MLKILGIPMKPESACDEGVRHPTLSPVAENLHPKWRYSPATRQGTLARESAARQVCAASFLSPSKHHLEYPSSRRSSPPDQDQKSSCAESGSASGRKGHKRRAIAHDKVSTLQGHGSSTFASAAPRLAAPPFRSVAVSLPIVQPALSRTPDPAHTRTQGSVNRAGSRVIDQNSPIGSAEGCSGRKA